MTPISQIHTFECCVLSVAASPVHVALILSLMFLVIAFGEAVLSVLVRLCYHPVFMLRTATQNCKSIFLDILSTEQARLIQLHLIYLVYHHTRQRKEADPHI